MFSIGSKENIGMPIAIVLNPKNDLLDGLIIRKLDENAAKKYKGTLYQTIRFKDKETKLQICPDTSRERQTIYITGSAGSGKSWQIKEYLKIYIKLYPKNPIYVFSRKQEDDSFKEIKKQLKYVVLNNSWLKDPILIEDIPNNCICVFDDIDTLPKNLKTQVYNLQSQVLNVGRSKKISCLMVSHDATSGQETKTQIREADSYIIFPRNNLPRTLLTNYGDLTNQMILKLKALKSRWVCVSRLYPPCVISDHEIIPLNLLEDYEIEEEELKENVVIDDDTLKHLLKTVDVKESGRGVAHCEVCKKSISYPNLNKHKVSKVHRKNYLISLANRKKSFGTTIDI